jgi:hypothetical protein
LYPEDAVSSGETFRWIHLRPLAFYAAVALLFLMPLPLAGRTHVIQTRSDVRQHAWWLWWTNEALREKRNPYLTDRLFYPTGVQLYLSPMDNVAGVLAIPLQRTIGLVAAYNLLILAGNAFSAYAMFLLALEVTRSRSGALVAGGAFGFAPLVSTATNMGQLEWANVGFMPLAVLGLVRLHQGPSWAVLPRAVSFSLAMLVTWYQGLFVAFFAGVYGAWRIVGDALRRDWKRMGFFGLRLATWGLVGLFLVAPLLLPTIRAGVANRGAEVPRSWVALNAAGPLDPFRPNVLHSAFGSVRGEASSALGYCLLGLAALGAVSVRRQAAFWLFSCGAFYLLALGPIVTFGEHRFESALLPYNLLYGLPLGLGRIPRTPVRFLFLVSIGTSILAAWGVARLQQGLSARGLHPRVVTVLALLLVLAELCPLPRPLQSASFHPVYGLLAKSAPGAVLELPRQRIADAMYGQTTHGKPLLGGYVSRPAPEGLRNYEIPVIRQLWAPNVDVMEELKGSEVVQQPRPIDRVPEVLDAYGVRYVLLHLDAADQNEVDRLKKILSRGLPPASVVWDDEEIRAYRVPEILDRRGVISGLGYEWRAKRGSPQRHRWSSAEGANVVLMLLDRSPRQALLHASMYAAAEAIPVEVTLNGRPWANLSLTTTEQRLSVPLALEPGYNVLRFRARSTASWAKGERGFALSSLEVSSAFDD